MNYPIIVGGFNESTVAFKETRHPTGKDQKFYIEGLAIPFGCVSSNGVLYTRNSLIESKDQWIGLPLMYNHLIEANELPIGKVVEMYEGTIGNMEGLIYKAEVDLQESRIINKIRNGYLNKVSIHILPSNVSHKEGYQEAIVGRPLELSVVPVPGFRETNMAVYMEKIKGDVNMKSKKENNEEIIEQAPIVSEDVVVKDDVKVAEEVKAEEVKAEEVKSEEVKAEEVKSEEVKPEEVIAEEVKSEEKSESFVSQAKFDELVSKIEKLNEKSEENVSNTKFNKLVSLVEDIVEGDDGNVDYNDMVVGSDIDVTLNDVADILAKLTARLELIEQSIKDLDNKEEEAEEDSEVTEEVADVEEEAESDMIIDEADAAMEKIKATSKKEKIKLVLRDLM